MERELKPLPYGEHTTICGLDGCDGCLNQHNTNFEFCKAEAIRNGFNRDEYYLEEQEDEQ